MYPSKVGIFSIAAFTPNSFPYSPISSIDCLFNLKILSSKSLPKKGIDPG